MGLTPPRVGGARDGRGVAEILGLIGAPLAILGGALLFLADAGRRLRLGEVGADYAQGFWIAALGFVVLQALPIPSRHRTALSLLWLVRLGVGLGVMLAYEARYGLDAANYYHNGRFLSDPLVWFAWGAGTQNITALTGLFTGLIDSYHAIKLIFAFIGLISVYTFYRAAALYLGHENMGVLYLLGLFPSILFWSSILGKDPVTLLGLALNAYGAVLLLGRGRLRGLLWILAGLALATAIRSWLGVIFGLPILVTYVLGARAPVLVKIVFVALAIPAFLVAIQSFQARFAVESAVDLVETTDRLAQGWARGGAAQSIAGGFGSLTDMVLFLPVGAFAALFRPLPGEILNPFGLLAGIENAVLLWLVGTGLWRGGWGWWRDPVLLWVALTLAAWASIYGFVSYQNLGTAFRFKVQVMPLLLLFALHLRRR